MSRKHTQSLIPVVCAMAAAVATVGIVAVVEMAIPRSAFADPPAQQWVRTYDRDTSNDLAYAAQQTSDGGYMLAGKSYMGAGPSDNFYLVKTDASGIQQWANNYGTANDDECYAAQQTSDGGYILAGMTYVNSTYQDDFYLVKTNSSGTLSWAYNYDAYSDDDQANAVQQTSDGGYILTGATQFSTTDYDFCIMKINSSGTRQWMSTRGGDKIERAYAVRQTSDGGYIVVGYTTEGTIGGRDIYAVKLDSAGNLDLVWTTNPCCFGSTATDEGYAVWQTTDGGYVIAGTTNPPGTSYNDFYLVKVSSTGSQLWTRTYDGDGRSDEAHSVRQTADGGFILGGRMSYAAGDYDFFLVRTDASGNQLWEYSYGPDTNEEGYGVQQTSDGGFVLGGSTGSGAGSTDDFYLLKLAADADVTVTAPNGGEAWLVGDSYNITWTSVNVPSSQNVKIELNRAYPGPTWETITASTPNDGTHPWAVPGPVTTSARVRVTGVEQAWASDTSNANFAISQRTVTVIAPNGGEVWIVGESNNFTWTSQYLTENVKIELNRAYPGPTWEVILASTSNDGSEPWTVTGPVTSAARVRISGVVHTSVADTSNADFEIGTRAITVVAPNGGETWAIGETRSLTWTSRNLTENVKIELNRDYPGPTWEVIAASTPNDGAEPWAVTGPVTSAARVRLSGVVHTDVADTSDGDFTVAPQPTIRLTSPNGGEIWVVDEMNTITWHSENLSDKVRIELDRAYPMPHWEILFDNTPDDGEEPWPVTEPETFMARMRIAAVNHPAVADTSDANFTITLDIASAEEVLPDRFCSRIPSGLGAGTIEIELGLPAASPVSAHIYDARGRAVRNLADGSVAPSGIHFLAWDKRSDSGVAVAAGVYFVRIEAGDYRATHRAVVLD